MSVFTSDNWKTGEDTVSVVVRVSGPLSMLTANRTLLRRQ